MNSVKVLMTKWSSSYTQRLRREADSDSSTKPLSVLSVHQHLDMKANRVTNNKEHHRIETCGISWQRQSTKNRGLKCISARRKAMWTLKEAAQHLLNTERWNGNVMSAFEELFSYSNIAHKPKKKGQKHPHWSMLPSQQIYISRHPLLAHSSLN